MQLLFANGILLSEINREYARFNDPNYGLQFRKFNIFVPLEKGTVLTLVCFHFTPDQKWELRLDEEHFVEGGIVVHFGDPKHSHRCE